MPLGYCDPRLGIVEIRDEDRAFFKRPLGEIYSSDTVDLLTMELMSGDKKVVTVGDKTTLTLIENGIIPRLSIVDKKEKRARSKYVPVEIYDRIVMAQNPKGSINFSLCKHFYEYIDDDISTLVIIEGEEDLLTALLIMMNRDDIEILYGQPNVGIVRVTKDAVNVTELAGVIVRGD